ncbi:PAS domain-containing protein [Azospirillum thermophilum]|uniref:Histidine kinase n=1 Tax=Azospirillum thermophilum TaxID=2202148 RepID=A0A2S2CV65_9PROT|nr:PAS domain-containing protein [Azospirillum thermophilum]AWK88270.1 hypothetical protein DEW08_19430 [Azospirillum thermophilum]
MVSASSRTFAHQCADLSSPSPFDDPSGEIAGLSVLKALRSPIWLFDPQSCRLLWANPGACLLLDAPDLASLLASSLPHALSASLQRCLAPHRDALARAEAVQMQVQWSLPPADRNILVDCLCSTTVIDGRPVLLVEGRETSNRWEVEESRATFDAILANAPMGIAIIDGDRRIRRVNQAMADIFQRPAASLLGAETRVMYSDDAVYEEVGRRAYPVLQRGGVFRDSFPMLRGNGSEVWCSLTGRRICPDDDSLGYVWMVEDISVRRRAEQTLNDSVAFQRVLLDTVPVPIFIQDVSGYYVNANAAFEQWLGIDRQSLFGKTVADLASGEHAQRDEEADRLLLAGGGTQTFETRVRCADGSQRDVVVSKAVYCRSGDKPAGIVGTMADISERKRAEQALRERHALFEQMFVSSRAVKLLVDPAGGCWWMSTRPPPTSTAIRWRGCAACRSPSSPRRRMRGTSRTSTGRGTRTAAP